MSSEQLAAAMRDDGFTLTRFIKSLPNAYEDTTLVVRPTGMYDKAALQDEIAKFAGHGDEERKINLSVAKMMVKKIKSWDAKNVHGEVVNLAPQDILDGEKGLHPALFTRIRSIVCFANEGGDALPTVGGRDEDAELLESLQKNSETA